MQLHAATFNCSMQLQLSLDIGIINISLFYKICSKTKYCIWALLLKESNHKNIHQ